MMDLSSSLGPFSLIYLFIIYYYFILMIHVPSYSWHQEQFDPGGRGGRDDGPKLELRFLFFFFFL